MRVFESRRGWVALLLSAALLATVGIVSKDRLSIDSLLDTAFGDLLGATFIAFFTFFAVQRTRDETTFCLLKAAHDEVYDEFLKLKTGARKAEAIRSVLAENIDLLQKRQKKLIYTPEGRAVEEYIQALRALYENYSDDDEVRFDGKAKEAPISNWMEIREKLRSAVLVLVGYDGSVLSNLAKPEEPVAKTVPRYADVEMMKRTR